VSSVFKSAKPSVRIRNNLRADGFCFTQEKNWFFPVIFETLNQFTPFYPSEAKNFIKQNLFYQSLILNL